jgi:hypothetical protein
LVLAIAVATGQAVESLRAVRPFKTAAPAAPLSDLAGITTVSAEADRQQDPCSPRLDLAAAPEAMIRLTLTAPCNVGERVLLRHSGLSFTAQVGLDGLLRLDLPALEEQALVAAYFEGSNVALQAVMVPDARRQPRFAFQAALPVQFDLRVEHLGHVYSGLGATGPVVTLGTAMVRDPLVAQVYSFPGPGLTDVTLTVEVRITPETCSRSFVAETVLSQGGVVQQQDVPIAVPLCGTPGDILVLKNLVAAPTVALPE